MTHQADKLDTVSGERLAQCPFCGGRDIEPEDAGYNGLGYLRCKTCRATGPEAINPDGVAKATGAWNKRIVRWLDAFELMENGPPARALPTSPQSGEVATPAEQIGGLIKEALRLAPAAGLFLEIKVKPAPQGDKP